MKTCLLVIDVQESFRRRPYFTEQDLPAYLAAQNALISAAQAAGTPIVRIFHVDGPRTPENTFALESGAVRPLDGLAPFEAAATFAACAWAAGDTEAGQALSGASLCPWHSWQPRDFAC